MLGAGGRFRVASGFRWAVSDGLCGIIKRRKMGSGALVNLQVANNLELVRTTGIRLFN